MNKMAPTEQSTAVLPSETVLVRRLSGPALHLSPVLMPSCLFGSRTSVECFNPTDVAAFRGAEDVSPRRPKTTEQTRETRRCRAVAQTRPRSSSNAAFKAPFAAAGGRAACILETGWGLKIFWLSRHNPSHTPPLKCCLAETT